MSEEGPVGPAPRPGADEAVARGWRRGPLAWQHRGLRRLALAWMLTNLADSALLLMLAVWVKDLSGSDSAAGLVIAALGLPALAAPLLGHLADRLSRRRLVVATDVVVALVVATLVLVDSTAQLWLVYLVVIVYGGAGVVSAAAQSGLVKDLVVDEHLASANAVLSTIDQVLRLLSPLVGTGLYLLAGPRAVIALTVVAFAGAAAVLAGLRVHESAALPAHQRARFWTQVGAGFAHLARTPPLGRLSAVVATGFAAAGLVNVAIFPVMDQGLGVPAATLGVLLAVQGAGAVAGGLSAAAVITRWGEARTITAAMAALALGTVPLLGTSLAAAAGGMAVLGVGVSWSIIALTTARQRLSPARLQGRTTAATTMAITLPQTLLTAAGAALLAVADYRLLIAATTAVVLTAAITSVRAAARPPARLEVPPRRRGRHDLGGELRRGAAPRARPPASRAPSTSGGEGSCAPGRGVGQGGEGLGGADG